MVAKVEDINEAMKDVVDPELGINVVDLGLIYDMMVDENNIADKNYFGFCAIENISHNNIIINNIMLKTKPSIISPTAYFFYNFAYPTFKAEKVLILN